MFKINTVSRTAVEEAIPEFLKGLSTSTLQNLQTELNPVPAGLENIEYWPRVNVSVDVGENQTLDGETHELDFENKVVKVTPTVVDKSAETLMTEATQRWEQDIAASDEVVSRVMEDLYDALDAPSKARVDEFTTAKILAKKSLREERPSV